jgi:tetratricopeptide (TPR) repeat protein
MEQQEKAELTSQRAIEKMLRSSFRASIAASEMGYAADLQTLYRESMNLQLPSDLQSARRYIKVLSAAASAHCSQGNFEVAKQFFVRAIFTARKYGLNNQELKAIGRLCTVLKQMRHFDEARLYLEEAVASAFRNRRIHYEMKYKIELRIVEALIAHREMTSTENGRVYFQNPSNPDLLNEEHFVVKQLEPAEAEGARRSIMRRTIKTSYMDVLLPRSRTNGGRRRASFVSTFLKNKVGSWMLVK